MQSLGHVWEKASLLMGMRWSVEQAGKGEKSSRSLGGAVSGRLHVLLRVGSLRVLELVRKVQGFFHFSVTSLGRPKWGIRAVGMSTLGGQDPCGPSGCSWPPTLFPCHPPPNTPILSSLPVPSPAFTCKWTDENSGAVVWGCWALSPHLQ